MKRISKKFSTDNDTGFGNSASNQGGRLINSDGTFNVERTGISFFDRIHFFHELLTMKWFRFNLLVLSFYVVVNLIFAILYYITGAEHLVGMEAQTEGEKFMETFFFSTQTLATVGYGRISPTGMLTNAIAALEALMGVMSFALVTGLLYGRFSRPSARVIVSHNMIVAPYQGISGLMFRLANARSNQLIEAEAQLILTISVPEDGKSVRKFYPLKLERDKVASVALNWTIVHPIDDDSPIAGMNETDLADGEAEFIFMFKAFDSTYSQTLHTRTSYKHHSIVWGAKFVQMFQPTADRNGTLLELAKISTYEKAELPLRLQKTASE